MATMREWLRRLSGTIRRDRADQDLEEELRLHVELLAEAAQRQGHSPEAAARRARLQAGGTAQAMESMRDQRGLPWLEDLGRDAQLGLRMMRRNPLFSAVAILSLALGIGANTAIFSLVNPLMLRALPVREPAQLVELLSKFPGEPRNNAFRWNVYEHFRDHNHVFSDLIGLLPRRAEVSGDALAAETVSAEYATGNFFPALGLETALGRLIRAEDDQLNADVVAVVSWSYWQNRFNHHPGIVGRRIVVDGAPATIVGVAPRAFRSVLFGSRPDVWLPAAVGRRNDSRFALGVVGRLKPGVSIEQARAEMRVLDRWRIEEAAKTAPFLRQLTIELEPAGAGLSLLRDYYGRPLLVLMAIVALLLLIACTNVAGMLLARGTARQRELAVRVSLGAAGFRLMRQMLTESVLLAGLGGALGTALAYFGVDALVRIVMSGRGVVGLAGPLQQIEAHLDAEVLMFTAAVSLLAGILFGIAPAWHALRSAPAQSLRETGTAGDARSKRLFGRGLIVAQVAISLVLLSTAGVFISHLWNLRNVGLGFNRHGVLLVTLDPSRSGMAPERLFQPYQDLLSRLEAIPGVRAATLSGVTPIHGAGSARFVNVPGFQEPPMARQYTSLNWVAPRYFETFGTPLVAGRDFQFADQGQARVAIVNQSMARYYFGDGNAVGRQFTLDGQDRAYEVIGVVGDAKYLDLHNAAPRTVYLNAFQESRMFSHRFSIRTDTAPSAVAGDVQRTVAEVMPAMAITRVTTLADQVDASIVPERLVAMLSMLFGSLGAVLVGIGLYGLLAYTVSRRTNEIGIRMALGATRHDMIKMVLAGAAGLVAAGLIVGAPFAWWGRQLASRWIVNLPIDNPWPITFGAIAMMVVGLAAAYLPARHAARVAPAEALRHL